MAEKDEGVYAPLCIAIQTRDWVKTKEFLDVNKDALIDKLNCYDERTLHVAIGNPKNIPILQKLLEMIDPNLLPNLVNSEQQNALHYAAGLDNIEAAKKLVEKNPYLLFTGDKDKCLPIETAIINCHKTTFLFLFDVCKRYISLISQKNGLHNPFKGKHGVSLLDETIVSGMLDVAYELLKKYPKLATTMVDDVNAPLYCIAKKWDAYPSAKRYNFYQRFVYSHVRAENYNLNYKHNKEEAGNQERNMVNLNNNVCGENYNLANKQTIETQEIEMANLNTNMPPENYNLDNKQDIENQDTDLANLNTDVSVENYNLDNTYNKQDTVNQEATGTRNYIYQALTNRET